MCQKKMATCTETALYVLQSQLNVWNKNGPSLSDSELICKSKAVLNFEIKLIASSKMLAKFLFLWDSGKIVYCSSWGHGGLSELSLHKQALYFGKIPVVVAVRFHYLPRTRTLLYLIPVPQHLTLLLN